MKILIGVIFRILGFVGLGRGNSNVSDKASSNRRKYKRGLKMRLRAKDSDWVNWDRDAPF